MTANYPMLSLVAEYDDLVRCRATLSEGIETEFLQFVLNQESCRVNWLERERHLEQIKANVNELEQQNVTLQTRLKHARSQIDHEIRKRQKVEHERDAVERQIALVRELLNDKGNKTALNDVDREKLAFLSTDVQNCQYTETSPKRSLAPIHEASASLLSPSDISFDKTEEDLELSTLRNGKMWKRSASTAQHTVNDNDTPPDKRTRHHSKKRHRRSRSAEIVATATDIFETQESVIGDGHDAKNSLQTSQRHRRHSSPGNTVDALDGGAAGDGRFDNDSPVDVGPAAATGFLSPVSGTPFGLKRYGSGSSLTRLHTFTSQTCIRPITCTACGKKLHFGKVVYKCRDCRACAHSDCRDVVPLPCVPSTVTPSSSKHLLTTGLISDYTPVDSPMIPAIVIHCIKEIETRGLTEVGIYRVPGSERDVKELKEKFLRGKCPNLALIDDIHVVCGCLKDFLRSLKESLVTYKLWKKFVVAAEMSDRFESITATYQAVSELPQQNRDTIAYVILHLQRVADSPHCKMPTSNLAKVFGPTVVGYSTPEVEPMQMLAETDKQAKVMERLMSISCDYWMTFINIDVNLTTVYGTPRMSEVPHSMLGPVGTASDLETPDKSRWFTPARSKHVSQSATKKMTFFSSPMLK